VIGIGTEGYRYRPPAFIHRHVAFTKNRTVGALVCRSASLQIELEKMPAVIPILIPKALYHLSAVAAISSRADGIPDKRRALRRGIFRR
jgi:hypothetical protein